MTLSNQQIQENINAMGKQGATNDDIKGYIDSLGVQGGTQNTPVDNTPAPEPHPFLSKVASLLGDIGTGIGQGATSTALGLGQIALKGYSAIPGLPSKDLVNQSIQTGEDIKNTQLAPQNIAQGIGKIGEQVGEMFIPVGLEGKIASKLAEIPELAKNAPLAAKVSQALLKAGIKSAGSAAEFGAKTYLQTGGDVNQAKNAGIIAGAVSPIAGAVKGVGRLIGESVIPVNSREAQLLQTYKANVPFWQRVLSGVGIGSTNVPTTAGKTAFDKGLMGTESMIGVGAKKGANNLWENLISPALKNSPVKQDMASFFDEAHQQILKENPELSRQKDLLTALDSLKNDYKGVKNATMPELQKFKEGWAKFIPEKVYRGKPIAGAFNDVKDIVSGIARTKIYQAVGPEAKQAYFDYGNLKGLQELGQKAMTGGKLKGGFGSFWSAIKDLAVTPVGTIGGQSIYKVGQGIELVGRQAAKTVSDIIPKPTK